MSKRNAILSRTLLLGALLALLGCGEDGASGGPSPIQNAGTGGGDPSGHDAGQGGGGGTGGTLEAFEPGGPIECTAEPEGVGPCKETAAGMYAVKTEIDVYWASDDPNAMVANGRGLITVWLEVELSELCENGSNARGIVRSCGSRVPPFLASLVCEAYQIEIPDAIWDLPTMPRFETRASIDGFDVGDALSIAKATGLIGISLDAGAAWPTALQTGIFTCPEGSGVDCFPDHDQDGYPGITAHMRTTGEIAGSTCPQGRPYGYRAPPLSADPNAVFGASVRADRMFSGVRVRLGGGGEVAADCRSGAGDAQAEYFDARVVGCMLREGSGDENNPIGPNEPCDIDAAEFIDGSMPVWKILQRGDTPPAWANIADMSPSLGARSSLVRIRDAGSEGSCAEVRDAAYPAYR